MTRPLIALDISRHDHLEVGYGLHRYGMNLVHGLARVRPDADFLLIGSRPEPVEEVRGVLAEPGSRWSYHQFHRRERGRGGYFLDQWSFIRQLRREPIRLYHSTDFFVPVLLPVPLVMTVHDLMFEIFSPGATYNEPFYLTCLKRAIRHRLSRVIAISRTTANDLRERWRVPPSKLAVVYNGAQLPGRTTPPPAPVVSGGPVLLARYALCAWKNLQSLVGAVAILRKEFSGIRLVLFGRADVGPEGEAAFNQRIDELGVGDAVVRTGVISDDELQNLYRTATLFVLPSLYEGFGLPLVEAMTCGTCVVAHNGASMAEILGTGPCLADVRTPESLAAAIAPLLRDPALRQQLARAGRDRAARFTVEAMAEATFNVYRTCLNG